jgi:thioredoxin 1
MVLLTARSDAEFDSIINSSHSTIVMFKDEHCSQCKSIKPSFVRRAQKYKEKQFLLVDINDIQNFKIRSSIKGMPTFSKYKSGKKIGSFTGADKPRLDHMIKY